MNKTPQFLFTVLWLLALSTPIFGQSPPFELASLYATEMRRLPTRISATMTFRSAITREQFIGRYDRFTDERLKVFRSAPKEMIDEECVRMGIAQDKLESSIKKAMEDGLRARLSNLEVGGKHEIYQGDFREIRSHSVDGVHLKTLQYGTSQPRLQTDTRNLWVILISEKKDGRTVLLTESRVSLNGMQHFAMYHPSIEEKFSSCFRDFWESIPEITYRMKFGNGEIFVKKHAEQKLGLKEAWLVCSISSPTNSIVPQWIARINAPGKSDLNNKEVEQVVDCSIAIQNGKSGMLPEGLYMHSLVTFSDLQPVGEFANFPKTITYQTCMDWKSNKKGFIVEAPFEEFQLKVSAINLTPELPPQIEVKDGDSFYDYETKSGMIIGQADVSEVGRYAGITRWFLWITAFGSVLLLMLIKIRR